MLRTASVLISLSGLVGCAGAALFLPVIIFWHTRENIAALMLFFGFLYGVPLGAIGCVGDHCAKLR